jgi:hypothetical protein
VVKCAPNIALETMLDLPPLTDLVKMEAAQFEDPQELPKHYEMASNVRHNTYTV